jgi:hypothetical protein
VTDPVLLERAKRFHARSGVDLDEAQVLAALAHRRRGNDLERPVDRRANLARHRPGPGRRRRLDAGRDLRHGPLGPVLRDRAAGVRRGDDPQRLELGDQGHSGLRPVGRLRPAGPRPARRNRDHLHRHPDPHRGHGRRDPTDLWPYGLLQNIRFSVNGSNLLNANGHVLRLPPPGDHAQGAGLDDLGPHGRGANTVEIHWVLPIADNMVNLWGAILTQSDDLYARLDYTVAPAPAAATLGGLFT